MKEHFASDDIEGISIESHKPEFVVVMMKSAGVVFAEELVSMEVEYAAGSFRRRAVIPLHTTFPSTAKPQLRSYTLHSESIDITVKGEDHTVAYSIFANPGDKEKAKVAAEVMQFVYAPQSSGLK